MKFQLLKRHYLRVFHNSRKASAVLVHCSSQDTQCKRDFLGGNGDNFGRAKGAASAQSSSVSGLRNALCVG
jgi:hypothetical protein